MPVECRVTRPPPPGLPDVMFSRCAQPTVDQISFDPPVIPLPATVLFCHPGDSKIDSGEEIFPVSSPSLPDSSWTPSPDPDPLSPTALYLTGILPSPPSHHHHRPPTTAATTTFTALCPPFYLVALPLSLLQIFFRSGALPQLEERRDERLQDKIVRFQARCRGLLARRQFARRKV